MTHWLHRLAQHYESLCRRHPRQRLLIVFDIDGTLLDTRPARERVLHGYDAAHGTGYFAALGADAAVRLDWSELVARSRAPARRHPEIVAELRRRWNAPDTALASHRAFQGVLEIIRWFQLQPHVEVAINTGRPECQRFETLRLLNQLGSEFRVRFRNELLFMRPEGQPDVLTAKRDGIRAMRRQGYRVFAVIDNEAENLAAIASMDHDGELLRVDARALREARRPGAPAGGDYDLRQLLTGHRLPRHVQLVWQDIEGEGDLQRFLTAAIRWGEVRLDGFRDDSPLVAGGRLPLERVLSAMIQRGRRCKINLPDSGALDRLLPWLRSRGFPGEALWLDLERGALPEVFRRLAEALPGSVRECRIAQWPRRPTEHPEVFQGHLAEMVAAGANRFGVDWSVAGKHALLDLLDARGCALHLHGVPDLESFLQATLLMPRSIGADFDFPRLSATRQAAPRRAG